MPSSFWRPRRDSLLNYRKLHWSFLPNFPSSKLHEKFGVSFRFPFFNANNKATHLGGFIIGVPEGNRTPDLSLRRRTLYPAELRRHFFHIIYSQGFFVNQFFIYIIIYNLILFKYLLPLYMAKLRCKKTSVYLKNLYIIKKL